MNENHEEQKGKKGSHFMCPVCTKLFSSVHNMVRHVENIHTLLKDHQHKCHLCGYTCETHNSLMDHKKSHQCICADCGKVYSSKGSLNIHTKKVHSGKTYPCLTENCSFVGTSQKVLDFHTNIHAGVKPFKCKHCGKSYPRVDTCSRHQLLCITGVTCDVCGTKFKSKSTLSDHVRAVHSDERFHCLCGSTFKYRANLHRHRKESRHVIPGNNCQVEQEYIAVPL